MNIREHQCMLRQLIVVVVTSSALMFCSIGTATEAAPGVESSIPANDLPGPVEIAVSGASAGITTEYMEQAVTDAILISHIFSGIDDSGSAEVRMPMIRADSVFSVTEHDSNTPYFLSIRVIKVITPSFSIRMTVSMNVIWSLYRTAENTELMHENIASNYTGGVFEGGLSGANRVRVAMEGAMRENIRIGMDMLAALNLEPEVNQGDKPGTEIVTPAQ